MPFLKNVWYVAAASEEIEAGLVSRRICDELIVMFKKEDGAIAALEDRCPHRFVPLSMGRREGDTLRCGYHGLRFDATGACVEKPGGKDENPTPVCVRSYPAELRHGYVWIWMGDPALATPDTIPDFSFITDPGFAVAKGYLNVKCHHELITDNLLDLSHVQFLHPEIASDGDWTKWKNNVVVEGNTVWSMLFRPSIAPGPLQRMLWGSTSERADGRGNVRWDAPSNLYADTTITEIGGGFDDGCQTPSAHLLTPETEQATHYFWGSGRNRKIEDDGITQMIHSAVHGVFTTQDGPMIEAEQAAMGDSTDFLAHKPLILKADAAGIRARRILRKLIREEQEGKSGEVIAEPAE